MFHQVHVNEEHCDFLCFLWWGQGDTTKEPEEYRMTVHLFSATSSLGCANLALRAAANNSANDLGEETVSFIKTKFYVDNRLKSTPMAWEAIKLIKNGTELSISGFRLHKFTSNSKEGVESIPIRLFTLSGRVGRVGRRKACWGGFRGRHYLWQTQVWLKTTWLKRVVVCPGAQITGETLLTWNSILYQVIRKF